MSPSPVIFSTPKPLPAGRDSHQAPAKVLAQTEMSVRELQVRDWDSDCFNCGDDPAHYSAPEGSIASSVGAGAKRNTELRARVMALHRAGLRADVRGLQPHHGVGPDRQIGARIRFGLLAHPPQVVTAPLQASVNVATRAHRAADQRA